MGHKAKKREQEQPKPVEKIELSDEHIGIRFAAVVILIIIAVCSFGYAINSLLTTEDGWREIEADSSADTNAANEFVFMYHLGSKSDMNATAENKAVIALYTDVMVEAYELFHSNQEFENVNNIYYINQHPNVEITVDDVLYNAFSLIQESGNRDIYLGPVYAQYDDIFFCEEDSQIFDYDPYTNTETAEFYQEVAQFAKDEEAVNVELLGDGKIRLCVSEEYMAYCDENAISNYIDFSWTKNAFILDYAADTLKEQGYTAGCISSYDGFVRNLDDSGAEFSLNIYDSAQDNIVQAATMNYSGQTSIVNLRNYPINSLDTYRYYTLDNGDIRTLYLDVEDGLCKSAVSNLYSYSEELSCAEILLQVAPIYISDELEEETLNNIKEDGIHSLYVVDKVIRYNEKDLSLVDIYASGELLYTTLYVE